MSSNALAFESDHRASACAMTKPTGWAGSAPAGWPALTVTSAIPIKGRAAAQRRKLGLPVGLRAKPSLEERQLVVPLVLPILGMANLLGRPSKRVTARARSIRSEI